LLCSENGETFVPGVGLTGPSLISGGLPSTSTTTMAPASSGCVHNGVHVADGDAIPSDNPCEHCYCMGRKVMCAVDQCLGGDQKPLEGKTDRCVPMPPKEGECCPKEYICSECQHSLNNLEHIFRLEQIHFTS
jgi:hypothetical protein